ncbi:MAG: peptidoglycan DD-metalloendopeptidase family protein [Pseudomonadota bacterium]
MSLGLCSLVVAKFTEDPSARFSPEAVLETVDPLPVTVAPEQPTALEAQLIELPAPEAAIPVAAALREVEVEVKPGDSLARIFAKHDVPARDLALLLDCEPLGPRLKNIYPGHKLTFAFAEDNTLMRLRYAAGPLAEVAFERIGTAFSGQEVNREPERAHAYRSGTIDHSLFLASQRAGLDDALTMQLAQMFQWDVDFVLDIRKGDEFHVLYEELYLGERFIGYGNILAAEFVNQGKSYRAVLFEDAEGDRNYFSPNGDSMRKAFLRAPVEFTRVSSNFNMRRKHPLFNRTMPHRGIDYAAPTGTPILAAGDGRVINASRNKYNGRYVVLKHGEQYTTKYLHLSKFARGVKAGSKVRQGQIIGYVGATGAATGPHLHYEFLVNGVHRNPRTVPLPNAAPIASDQREDFTVKTASLLSALGRRQAEATNTLALAD